MSAPITLKKPSAGGAALSGDADLKHGILVVESPGGVFGHADVQAVVRAGSTEIPGEEGATPRTDSSLFIPPGFLSPGTDSAPGIVQLAVEGDRDPGLGQLLAVQNTDPALTNARDPLPHVHATSDITSGAITVVRGGTGTSATLIGLVRGSASAMTAAELSGDVSTSGSNAVTVTKINGVALSGLGTGLLKNTTGTGAPSIAVGSDLPAHNQAASTITSGVMDTARLGSGTANGDTFLSGDQTYKAVGSLISIASGDSSPESGDSPVSDVTVTIPSAGLYHYDFEGLFQGDAANGLSWIINTTGTVGMLSAKSSVDVYLLESFVSSSTQVGFSGTASGGDVYSLGVSGSVSFDTAGSVTFAFSQAASGITSVVALAGRSLILLKAP